MGEMADLDVAAAEWNECPFCHDDGCPACEEPDEAPMAFIDTSPEPIEDHPSGGALYWLAAALFLAACMALAAL